jgi:hypothetical protein
MKQRNLFDDTNTETPKTLGRAATAPQANQPKMIRGAVYQPDFDAIVRAKPTKPQGADREAGTCAYCGEPVWGVGVTTKLNGDNGRGMGAHHTPELVWLDGGGFGWVWVWHARYCKGNKRGGPPTFNDPIDAEGEP